MRQESRLFGNMVKNKEYRKERREKREEKIEKRK